MLHKLIKIIIKGVLISLGLNLPALAKPTKPNLFMQNQPLQQATIISGFQPEIYTVFITVRDPERTPRQLYSQIFKELVGKSSIWESNEVSVYTAGWNSEPDSKGVFLEFQLALSSLSEAGLEEMQQFMNEKKGLTILEREVRFRKVVSILTQIELYIWNNPEQFMEFENSWALFSNFPDFLSWTLGLCHVINNQHSLINHLNGKIRPDALQKFSDNFSKFKFRYIGTWVIFLFEDGGRQDGQEPSLWGWDASNEDGYDCKGM